MAVSCDYLCYGPAITAMDGCQPVDHARAIAAVSAGSYGLCGVSQVSFALGVSARGAGSHWMAEAGATAAKQRLTNWRNDGLL